MTFFSLKDAVEEEKISQKMLYIFFFKQNLQLIHFLFDFTINNVYSKKSDNFEN